MLITLGDYSISGEIKAEQYEAFLDTLTEEEKQHPTIEFEKRLSQELRDHLYEKEK